MTNSDPAALAQLQSRLLAYAEAIVCGGTPRFSDLVRDCRAAATAIAQHAATARALEQEKCDKCGRMFPRRLVAIELKDGAPIDDPAGFQWCIVCHGIRVHEQQLARIVKLEAQLTATARALVDCCSLRDTYKAQLDGLMGVTEKEPD